MPEVAELEILEGMPVEVDADEHEDGAEAVAAGEAQPPVDDTGAAAVAAGDDDESSDAEFDAKVGQQLYGPWKEKVEGLKKKRDQYKAEAKEALEAKAKAARLEAELSNTLLYANQIRQQAEATAARLAQVEPAYKQEAVRARQQLLQSQQNELAAALEAGDHARAAEINRAMIATQQQHAQFESWTPQKPGDLPPAPAPVAAAPTKRDNDWLAKNAWFDPRSPQFNPEMHQYALSVDRALMQGGYIAGSDEYYQEVDRQISSRFQVKSEQAKPVQNQRQSPAMPVVAGSRTSPSGRKLTTTVTRDDIDTAAKLSRSSGMIITGADIAKQRIRNQMS